MGTPQIVQHRRSPDCCGGNSTLNQGLVQSVQRLVAVKCLSARIFYTTIFIVQLKCP